MTFESGSLTGHVLSGQPLAGSGDCYFPASSGPISAGRFSGAPVLIGENAQTQHSGDLAYRVAMLSAQRVSGRTSGVLAPSDFILSQYFIALWSGQPG